MSLEDVSVSTVSVVALKLQAATGTPEVLTAADAEIVTTECTILPDHNVTDDRVDTNSDGTETAIPNGQTGKATLTVELGGSGSSANLPAWAVALLPASGWEKNASSNVFTYSPGSDSIITLACLNSSSPIRRAAMSWARIR